MAVPAQHARRHKSVAAVVAGTAEHRDRRFGAGEVGHGCSHGAAGGLHQGQAGCAGGDGQTVGARHLLGGDELGSKLGRCVFHGRFLRRD
jgi:hypothetical protein